MEDTNLQSLDAPQSVSDQDCETDALDDNPETDAISAHQATGILYELEKFFISKGMPDEAQWLCQRAEIVRAMAVAAQQQTKITDFFRLE